MNAMASQITSLTIVYWTVYLGVDQRQDQSSASLAFVWGIHRWPVNSPHKRPVTQKMFPFDDVIMGLPEIPRATFIGMLYNRACPPGGHYCSYHWGQHPQLWMPSDMFHSMNTLKPEQNGCHFADILRCFYLKKKIVYFDWNFVEYIPIHKKPALVQIMAQCTDSYVSLSHNEIIDETP